MGATVLKSFLRGLRIVGQTKENLNSGDTPRALPYANPVAH